MNDLKPCPCCGATAELRQRRYDRYNGDMSLRCWIECAACGLGTVWLNPYDDDMELIEDALVERWNRRTEAVSAAVTI